MIARIVRHGLKPAILLFLTLITSTGLQAQAPASISGDGKCYGPDCAWYQTLLNTLEEAEDKARSAKSCMQRLLELEEIHRESLRDVSEITSDQMDRTVLAYQTGKVLRGIAKGAWEAAKFLSANPSSVISVLEEMNKAIYGSDETKGGDFRKSGMATGNAAAFKEEAIAQAKAKLKDILQSKQGGFPPSAAQGAADGIITTAVNAIAAGNQGGFDNMLVADIAAQAINGYVQGLNEERKNRIKVLEGNLSAEGAAIAQANERIFALKGKLKQIDGLLAGIASEKQKLLASAQQCRLKQSKACWDAYDQALANANKAYRDVLKKLRDAESKLNRAADKAAGQAQAARDRLKSAFEEINALEKKNSKLIEDYKKAAIELESAEQGYKEAQEEASKFSRENNLTGYTQAYTDLITKFNNDRQRLRKQVRQLEQTAKPIIDKLARLREGIDTDFEKLAEANAQHKKLEKELDQLKKNNKTKQEQALASLKKSSKQAKTDLDACLKKVYANAKSRATLSFTVARKKGGACNQLLADAQAGYDAVRRNNKPKNIEIACPKKEVSSICPAPAANKPIQVGTNSKVGSGAELTKKVGGMVGGALGGLFGGSGIGLGGGGSSFDDADTTDDPETVDDPVPDSVKKKFTHSGTGNQLEIGGSFNDKGLLISSTINNAEGDGTFQSVFLEDPSGNRGGPVGYWIYEIYSEWSLTVSWTRERYVDGQLVERTQGGWSEGGSTLLDTFKVPVYEEAIWSQLGFGNATKGIRSLGTQFLITKEQLKEQPVYLVEHITRPEQDPVTTVPFIIALSLSENGELLMEQVSGTKADTDCAGKPRIKTNKPAPSKPAPAAVSQEEEDDF